MASSAPGRSRRHGVRTGTLTWYSEVSETTDSRVATGQYSELRKSTCSGQQPAEQGRPGQHQRDHDDADEQHDDVQAEGQHPGADDAAHAAEPVHDRAGVDEDVEGPRAGPQGDQEADRDEVEAVAGEDVVAGSWLDDVGDDVGGEDVARAVEDAVLDLGDDVLADPGRRRSRSTPTRPRTSGGSDSRAKKPASAASPVTRYRKQTAVVSLVSRHSTDATRATSRPARCWEPARLMRSVPAATPLR